MAQNGVTVLFFWPQRSTEDGENVAPEEWEEGAEAAALLVEDGPEFWLCISQRDSVVPGERKGVSRDVARLYLECLYAKMKLV